MSVINLFKILILVFFDDFIVYAFVCCMMFKVVLSSCKNGLLAFISDNAVTELDIEIMNDVIAKITTTFLLFLLKILF